MTAELLFAGASFVVGVGVVVDGIQLLRHRGATTKAQIAFSVFEFAWTVLCLFLIFAGRLPNYRWLALMFVAYLPLSIVVALTANPGIMRESLETVRAPRASAYFAQLFGLMYALAALVAIIQP